MIYNVSGQFKVEYMDFDPTNDSGITVLHKRIAGQVEARDRREARTAVINRIYWHFPACWHMELVSLDVVPVAVNESGSANGQECQRID